MLRLLGRAIVFSFILSACNRQTTVPLDATAGTDAEIPLGSGYDPRNPVLDQIQGSAYDVPISANSASPGNIPLGSATEIASSSPTASQQACLAADFSQIPMDEGPINYRGFSSNSVPCIDNGAQGLQPLTQENLFNAALGGYSFADQCLEMVLSHAPGPGMSVTDAFLAGVFALGECFQIMNGSMANQFPWDQGTMAGFQQADDNLLPLYLSLYSQAGGVNSAPPLGGMGSFGGPMDLGLLGLMGGAFGYGQF